MVALVFTEKAAALPSFSAPPSAWMPLSTIACASRSSARAGPSRAGTRAAAKAAPRNRLMRSPQGSGLGESSHGASSYRGRPRLFQVSPRPAEVLEPDVLEGHLHG